MIKKNIITTSLAIMGVVAVGSAYADEGQWQPHQLKQLQSEFDRVGIELPCLTSCRS